MSPDLNISERQVKESCQVISCIVVYAAAGMETSNKNAEQTLD